MTNSQCTILDSCANRPISANFLEVQGGVKWIGFQNLEILVGNALNAHR